ncbi:hypothetical protein [Pararhizobium gei]|uniref:hypothetical protein n=1 Tax=Pararhizobium gei TaxID=1395951 RepID=UPI0023DCE0C1|nr:hypothetical protein [Rhizobium gei]
MTDDELVALYKAGKFKEALAAAIGENAKSKFSPTRLVMDKQAGKLRCYRGNKRVEKDDKGEWHLAKMLNAQE